MNPLTAARGDKSAMRPLVKLLWILVIIIILHHKCEVSFSETQHNAGKFSGLHKN